MTRGKWILAILIALILIILGGFREIVFVNINEQILFNSGGIDSYRVVDLFKFLGDYSQEELINVKWILTVSFALMFLLLSMFSFAYILSDKAGAKWIAILYAAGLIIAGIVFVGGKFLGDPETGYTLSRVIMGALQSPFPLMLMIPARMLAKG